MLCVHVSRPSINITIESRSHAGALTLNLHRFEITSPAIIGEVETSRDDEEERGGEGGELAGFEAGEVRAWEDTGRGELRQGEVRPLC